MSTNAETYGEGKASAARFMENAGIRTHREGNTLYGMYPHHVQDDSGVWQVRYELVPIQSIGDARALKRRFDA